MDTGNSEEIFLRFLVWNNEWQDRLWRFELDNGMEESMHYINRGGGVNAESRTIDGSHDDEAVFSGLVFACKFDIVRYPGVVRKVLESF